LEHCSRLSTEVMQPCNVLVSIYSHFASVLYNAFLNLEKNWETIIDDIAAGRLSTELRIDDNIREKINAHLQPNPQRAAALRVSNFTNCSHSLQRRM